VNGGNFLAVMPPLFAAANRNVTAIRHSGVRDIPESAGGAWRAAHCPCAAGSKKAMQSITDEPVFRAPQALRPNDVALSCATGQFYRNCSPAMAADPEVICCSPAIRSCKSGIADHRNDKKQAARSVDCKRGDIADRHFFPERESQHAILKFG
jgi:hypothetical protein